MAALIGAVSLLSLGAVAVVCDYPYASRELPKALADYRAEGLPWMAAEVAEGDPARPDENAASLLRRSIAALPQGGTLDVRSRSAR